MIQRLITWVKWSTLRPNEFLFIPEEDIVYDIPDDNQLIQEIAETYKEDIDEVNAEEMDDSTEIPIVSAPVVHSYNIKASGIYKI